jgi:hypothetical protein
MGKIVKAGAWCNGEVAYLAWEADGPIADCLGFMIVRVQVTADGVETRRVLPTWIAFIDQSNPQWLDQDSSVWPIQQYQWRDLTLRRSRDTTAVRPINFAVSYEITPVGPPGPGRAAVPPSDTAVFLDADGNPRYLGPPHPLAVVGEMFATEPVDVTHDHGPVRATYTNGILSTQNLLQQLEAVQGTKPPNVGAGPTTGITPGLLSTLKKHIPVKGDPIRTFLTADVLSFLTALIDRAENDGGELFLALYELHDPELIERLTKLTQAGQAHVILSTAGATDLNPKNAPPPRQPVVWDTENHDARAGLHAAKPANVQDRLFNNASHIGHNKFVVYVKDGQAQAVLSGSTNWTETGLCTQSNNAILIEDGKVAELYLAYWKRLLADPQPPGKDLVVKVGNKTAVGFEKSAGVQDQPLRAANAESSPPVTLADGKTSVEVWFSPNTKAKTKSADSPTPIDLSRVYGLMEHAKDAILFLTFLPGIAGNQNIIGPAAQLAKDRPNLLVQGAVSDPSALPPPLDPGAPTTYKKPDGTIAKLPQRALWWPAGANGRVVMIRAAAITQQIGDLRPELLTAGHAIIHDKVIVIDPLDPVNCAVITGSHNLGYKASYQNDENLLIVRGNPALAISYAVHVLDVYDHYVMRARLADELRDSLLATGLPPEVKAGGFLSLTPTWQQRWFKADPPPNSRDYFLTA